MAETKKIKRPFSFYMCSLTFSFERAAYYASKWLIFAYLTAAVVKGGLGINKGDAGVMQAYLVAFTYFAPIIGGFIADRFIGARYLIPLGLIIMGIGYSICGYSGTYGAVVSMVVLVSIGTGFFKTNLSALTGRLFNDDEQKDSAFSTQYSFINVGSFIGTTAVAYLYVALATGEKMGYLSCFKLAGIMCFLGAIWFVIGWRFLGEVGKRPFKEGEKIEKVKVKHAALAPYEKRRVFSIILISLFSVIFWTFWYLSYLAVYDYSPNYINMNVFGHQVATALFDSENALLCIILGPILGALWYKLSKRPQGDMSLYKKLSLGLLLLGLSFLMLVGAEIQRGVGAPDTSKASILWIVVFGILLSLGEMVFSPLGNSFISKYAPIHIVSVLMAVWTVATFISAQSYGFIYKWTLTKNFFYVYIGIAAILVVLAALLFIFEKPLARMVELKDGETLIER